MFTAVCPITSMGPFTFMGHFTCIGRFLFCVAFLHLYWDFHYNIGPISLHEALQVWGWSVPALLIANYTFLLLVGHYVGKSLLSTLLLDKVLLQLTLVLDRNLLHLLTMLTSFLPPEVGTFSDAIDQFFLELD